MSLGTRSALHRVRRARYTLAGVVVLTALLWAGSVAMSVVIVAAAADLLTPLPSVARGAIIPAALLGGLIAAGAVLWRGRAAQSATRVALWLEEREPRLQFALVTAIDPRVASAAEHAELHAAAGSYDLEALVRRGWTGAVARAVAVVALTAAALALLQPQQLLRAAGSELSRRIASGPLPMPNRLSPLEAEVTPPSYARLPSETLRDPGAVAALVGSRIVFTGRGEAVGITAELPHDTVDAAPGGRNWSVGVIMPIEPTVVTLRDRGYRHLVLLEPLPDSAPTVRLRIPATDTTYQHVPRGPLEILATLADDVGLDSGHVEYMLSAGSGENFDVKRIRGSRSRFGNAREATVRAVIRLDTLSLVPGSVVHIRVVAWDANDVAAKPGMGASETRTLRIAEKLDSTSINPVPPLPIDSMWISQRLLNMHTDSLIRARPGMDPKTFAQQSSAASNTQEDIRQRALAVIGILEEDGVGGTFASETSAKLREAVALMWTARMFLGVAEPETAMPEMVKILAILDEIRLAHRYYLRGLLAPLAVDVERVRLTGTDSADAARRAPRQDLPDARRELAARIDRAITLLPRARQAGIDSLTYVRVRALSVAPGVAEALRQAVDALRRGQPADQALARVRRALEPPARITSGPVTWGGVTP